MQYDQCPRCNIDLDDEHIRIMLNARRTKAILGDQVDDIKVRDYYCIPCWDATKDEEN